MSLRPQVIIANTAGRYTESGEGVPSPPQVQKGGRRGFPIPKPIKEGVGRSAAPLVVGKRREERGQKPLSQSKKPLPWGDRGRAGAEDFTNGVKAK